MIVSRLVGLGRGLGFVSGRRLVSTSTPRSSGGHATWTYRSHGPPNAFYEKWADVTGVVLWWWVFWNLFTNYPHLIGEKAWIDPNCWTDEELGIPPDDSSDPE